MKIEKYVCDRCGREIFISSNKPSITLHKGDTELDLCGTCISSFFNWYYKEENKEESQTTYDSGYNCGYADAMNDIAESEEEK